MVRHNYNNRSNNNNNYNNYYVLVYPALGFMFYVVQLIDYLVKKCTFRKCYMFYTFFFKFVNKISVKKIFYF